MNKNHPFILLPTDKSSSVLLKEGKAYYTGDNTEPPRNSAENQFIYILSNEKPKETEWTYCYFHLGNKIFKAKGEGFICNACKKIIATNNPELCITTASKIGNTTPKISQSDIEYIISLYNKESTGTYISKLITKYTTRLISDYPEEDKIHITLIGFLNESKEQPKGDEVMVVYELVDITQDTDINSGYEPKIKEGYIVIIK